MATPLKKQFPVDAGTEIGSCGCHACGGTVFVTISKSGAAYYNCYNRSEKSGRPCQAHLRWGAADSAEKRRAHLIKTGAIQPVKQAANLNRPPIKAVEDQAKGTIPPKPANDNHEDKGGDEYGIGI